MTNITKNRMKKALHKEGFRIYATDFQGTDWYWFGENKVNFNVLERIIRRTMNKEVRDK